jgi:hypothetical protein
MKIDVFKSKMQWKDQPDETGWWWFKTKHKTKHKTIPCHVQIEEDRFYIRPFGLRIRAEIGEINQRFGTGKWQKALMPKE